MARQWVKAGNEWIDFTEVEFLDVEETPHGDEYTFEYEGETYKSLCVIGGKPGA